MTFAITPYRRFPGTARQAMEFYQSIFGGELTVATFRDVHSPEDVGGEANLDQVMHADLSLAGTPLLYASDSPAEMGLNPGNDTPVAVTGFAEDLERITGFWDALADEAEITMPFAEVPWGASFGMLVDRFGTHWYFNVAGTPAP